MNKLFSALIAALMFVGFSVNAADLGGTATADATVPDIPLTQTFVNNKDGEIVFVESRANNMAFPAVVAAFKKAGYNPVSASSPGTKTDTWCKVGVYLERRILGECYTPQMRHGIAIRNELSWTKEEFKGDYSGVPVMIAKIRDEHRCLSTVLHRKQSSVHGPSLPVLGAPNAPPEGYFATEC